MQYYQKTSHLDRYPRWCAPAYRGGCVVPRVSCGEIRAKILWLCMETAGWAPCVLWGLAGPRVFCEACWVGPVCVQMDLIWKILLIVKN